MTHQGSLTLLYIAESCTRFDANCCTGLLSDWQFGSFCHTSCSFSVPLLAYSMGDWWLMSGWMSVCHQTFIQIAAPTVFVRLLTKLEHVIYVPVRKNHWRIFKILRQQQASSSL